MAAKGTRDGLVESLWLGAAIVVPLFFNHQALGSFGFHKEVIVRVLAAITAVAWLVNAFVGRRPRSHLPRPPGRLLIALGLFLGSQLLATFFSVYPMASIWGDLEFGQGLVTLLAEVVLFLAISGLLRREDQVHRLVAVITTTSIPVALYGIIQQMGYDPIPYAEPISRSFSTLGHGIHLGGYLAMVMPLTWWKIIQEMGRARGQYGRLFFPGGVAVIQALAFFDAQSRGPLLGFLTTLAIFWLFYTLHTRRWKWLRSGFTAIGILLVLLVFINLPLAFSSKAARALGVQRFANTLALREGADPYRKAHWEAAVDLMLTGQPIAFPTGGNDRWLALRPWIGYGPETLGNVLPQRFIWTVAETKTEARLHNQLLDRWYGSGVVGLLTFLGFFYFVWCQGLRGLGWQSRTANNILALGAVVLVTGLFCAVGGRGFLGLGLTVGVVSSCGLAFLLGRDTRCNPETPPESRSAKETLIVALLAALGGHLIETGFAFTVADTSLLFWLFAGVLMALPSVGNQAPDAPVARTQVKSKSRRGSNQSPQDRAVWLDGCLAGCGTALALTTLLFCFLKMYLQEAIDWETVLAQALTRLKSDHGPSHLVWLLLIPTWLAANFALVRESKDNRGKRFLIALLVSGAIASVGAIVLAAQTASVGPVPAAAEGAAPAIAQLAGYQILFNSFLGLALVLMLAVAWLLDRASGEASNLNVRGLATNLVIVAAGLLAAWFICLREVHADIAALWGRTLYTLSRPEASVEVLRRSVQEQPHSVVYRRELADSLIAKAQTSRDFSGFDWLASEAAAARLPATREAHGLTPASADLARLYLAWSAFDPEPARRVSRAQEGANFFDQAACYLPGHAFSWLDYSVLETLLHQPDDAERKFQTAVGLMQDRAGYWANSYREQCVACSAPELRDAYAKLAFRLFDIAIAHSNRPAAVAVLRIQRAELDLGLGRLAEARQECLDAGPSLSKDDLWQADSTLGLIDLRRGDRTAAGQRLDMSIAEAPADKKDMLRKVRKEIDRQ
jgi:hypothetical protein